MTAFLFWNLGRKNLCEQIVNIANFYDVDIFIFAECTIPIGNILSCLNVKDSTLYHYAASIGCKRIQIFTRFPSDFIVPILETDKLTIRNITLPGLDPILLAAIHFPSKIHWTDISQSHECIVIAESIIEAESIIGHRRTVLVGDLNMNPFESGIVSASGLHSIMSRKIAEKKKRTVQSKEYQYFYNPMWSLFGDISPGPPGTYFYRKAEHVVYFWNMFDQVMIRPELIDAFDNSKLKIINYDGEKTLLSKEGTPKASDHLPLLFKLNL